MGMRKYSHAFFLIIGVVQMPSKAQINTAIVALVAFAVVAAVQKHVMPVPVVGAYLPR